MPATPSTLDQTHFVRAILAMCEIPSHDVLAGMHKSWWTNPLNPKSLRLTRLGYHWFRNIAELEGHSIELAEPITPKHLLQLERLFTQPYHIVSLSVIVVYSEEDAVMLQLQSGDLATYLDNLEL